MRETTHAMCEIGLASSNHSSTHMLIYTYKGVFISRHYLYVKFKFNRNLKKQEKHQLKNKKLRELLFFIATQIEFNPWKTKYISLAKLPQCNIQPQLCDRILYSARNVAERFDSWVKNIQYWGTKKNVQFI